MKDKINYMMNEHDLDVFEDIILLSNPFFVEPLKKLVMGLNEIELDPDIREKIFNDDSESHNIIDTICDFQIGENK